MKRRSFLQTLAGFISVSIAPNIPAKEIYPRGQTPVLQHIDESPFHLLTIDNFGAKDTLDITDYNHNDDMLFDDISWVTATDWFPKEAKKGHVFYFDPTHYNGVILPEEIRYGLTGSYIYIDSHWAKIEFPSHT